MQLAIGPLPDDAIAAAAAFHAEWLPKIDAALATAESHITLVFAPASLSHAGWRLAAVQLLARERAPTRINAVAGDDPAGIAATIAFISAAPGVTGQYLVIDGNGAGQVLS